MLLSVVIPAKNEEDNIARCIESVVYGIPENTEYEIILVDCGSTDKTIDIAKNYPIKILRLKKSWFHSSPAAKYTGCVFARGEFIFFIDSDMALEKDFLRQAFIEIKKSQDIAGVGGIADEIYAEAGKETGILKNLYRTKDKITEVDFLAGAILYRKKTLDEAGSFNPYLNAGAEEHELAERLKQKGYRLISIPFPMAAHYTQKVEDWSEFLRKKRAGLYKGIGISLGAMKSPEYILKTLIYYKEFLGFLIFMLCAFVLTINCIIFCRLELIFFIFLPVLTLLTALIIKKKSFKKAFLGLIKWFLISFEILKGLTTKIKDPALYPKDPEIIKD